MKPKVEIKPLKSLENLGEKLKDIYLAAYGKDYLYAYRDPARVKRYLKWLMKHAKGGFFVAFVDGKPVGFLALQPDCRFHGETIPEIHEFVVHPDYQRLGIGHRLMEEALNFLREQGFSRVALWVGEKNEKARRFYERLGFRVTGKQGAWLRMEKDLHDPDESKSRSLSKTRKASTTSESSMVSSGV